MRITIEEAIRLIDNISELLSIVRVEEIKIIQQTLESELSIDGIYNINYGNNKVTSQTIEKVLYLVIFILI